MSKLKETITLVADINKSADEVLKLDLTSEKIRNYNLGVIAALLSDIAQSLAVIADSTDKKED